MATALHEQLMNLTDGPYEYLNGCLGEASWTNLLQQVLRLDMESNMALYRKWMKLGRKPCLVSLVNGDGKLDDPWERTKLFQEGKMEGIWRKPKRRETHALRSRNNANGRWLLAYNAYTAEVTGGIKSMTHRWAILRLMPNRCPTALGSAGTMAAWL